MFAVRFHGRGGQGVVTAAELLASAAFCENRYAQAFPSFGSERMGAPVTSFCRIDRKPIRTHEPITEPDALIIQDSTLLHQAGLFAGLVPDGYVVVNSVKTVDQLGLTQPEARHRPLPGAAMLGGFAALTGAVGLDAVLGAIGGRFTGKVAAGNAAAARDGFDFVTGELRAVSRHA